MARPEVAFRPYLFTAVRNCFYDRARRKEQRPDRLPTDEVNVALIDSGASEDDKALAAAASGRCPSVGSWCCGTPKSRGEALLEVAPLLGLAPNAVAALAYRAREGFRQAYLQAHLRTRAVRVPQDVRRKPGRLRA